MADPTCPKCGGHHFSKQEASPDVFVIYCLSCGHIVGSHKERLEFNSYNQKPDNLWGCGCLLAAIAVIWLILEVL